MFSKNFEIFFYFLFKVFGWERMSFLLFLVGEEWFSRLTRIPSGIFWRCKIDEILISFYLWFSVWNCLFGFLQKFASVCEARLRLCVWLLCWLNCWLRPFSEANQKRCTGLWNFSPTGHAWFKPDTSRTGQYPSTVSDERRFSEFDSVYSEKWSRLTSKRIIIPSSQLVRFLAVNSAVSKADFSTWGVRSFA